MSRAVGLGLTLVDGSNGQGIGEASVRLWCTGGGTPPSDQSAETAGQAPFIFWSDRASGDSELDISAAGYQSVHRVGVLVMGDGPQPLELILERTR